MSEQSLQPSPEENSRPYRTPSTLKSKLYSGALIGAPAFVGISEALNGNTFETIVAGIGGAAVGAFLDSKINYVRDSLYYLTCNILGAEPNPRHLGLEEEPSRREQL